MWEVGVTDQFVEWWQMLSVDQQESVTTASTCSPAADDLYDELRDQGLI